jgi:hypothetical protein
VTVAGISLVRNEADILDASIRHMLNQGVDFLLIADHGSTDGTREILDSFGPLVTWVANTDPLYRQVAWMNELAMLAHSRGADWLIPFDADEIWLSALPDRVDRLTLKEHLEGWHDSRTGSYWATLYHHRDWDHKFIPAEPLPKVAYHWSPTAKLAAGNHSVEGLDPRWMVGGGLEIRHLQYRSAEHFIAKVRDHNSTLTPEMRARGEGAHKSQYEHLTDDELLAVYAEMCAQPTVFDPILVAR